MGTILNEEDLKQLTEIDLKKLLESENKLYHSLGSNLYDKGEKLLKHIDLINSIIKEKRNCVENNIINNIGGLSLKDNNFNNNMDSSNNSIFSGNNSNSGGSSTSSESRYRYSQHHIKQLSVEESSHILQNNMIENKVSSMDKKFNEFGVDSPKTIRNKRNNINNINSVVNNNNNNNNININNSNNNNINNHNNINNKNNLTDNTNSEMDDDDDIQDNDEHDYVNPDDLDDEVDLVDPFEDKPYDEGFNYKLNDEFHYFDDDT